jgi:hypothetical protein
VGHSCRAATAKDNVDVAAVTCARVALFTIQDRIDRAVEACFAFLRRVGIEWSPHPTVEEVRQEYERMWRQLGDRPIEALIDLPPWPMRAGPRPWTSSRGSGRPR